MSALFEPLTIRGKTLRNRIGVSPMCQYSARDGFANAWHMTHLVSRAVGGAGLVIVEATAVTPDGRISPADLGIWSEAHRDALAPIAAAISAAGAIPGIQLAHAGRKGSTRVPWESRGAVIEGGWAVPAPSALPFSVGSPATYALDERQIAAVIAAFAAAATRAVEAGFTFLECHFAHGYLIHEFLSPISNHRTDGYGGDFAGRARLALEVVRAVRAAAGEAIALSVRLSCVDWSDGGWRMEDSIRLAGLLAAAGADLIDCSSGAIVPGDAAPDVTVQHDFARAIRAIGVATAAVGGFADPVEAERMVAEGGCDIVLLARAMLRDPYWALHAARALGVEAPWPVQYLRAVGRGLKPAAHNLLLNLVRRALSCLFDGSPGRIITSFRGRSS